MRRRATKADKTGLRRAAERRLSRRRSVSTSETDVEKLRILHELQVHQVELEIQNEELLRTRSEVEARLAVVAQHTRHSVLITDAEGEIVWSNQAFTATTGFGRKDTHGRRPLDLLRGPETEAAALEELRRALEGRTELDVEMLTYHKTGSTSWSHIKVDPVFDRAKRLTQFVWVQDDIGARKRAEEEREHLQAQLRHAHKMESVGRLAGGVAHDFNNMLEVILGFAQIAMREVGEQHPAHARLIEIHEAALRSANLTRKLMTFARRQAIRPCVLDLNETASKMIAALERLIGEDIELVWRPGAELWAVEMDPDQIDQVLANLSINARDAIAGTGRLVIETHNLVINGSSPESHGGAVPGEYVHLKVQDNGCGMVKETLEHLFEPFFTTKEQDKGTGLGTSTVYGIVKQNGGFIAVDSEPGEGTTVHIYWPRTRANPAPALPSRPARPSSGSETILIVEDEPAILALGKLILERCGYHVLAASAGADAIALCRSHAGPIDLLLSDISMPKMNGVELKNSILTLRPTLKVLFMSGHAPERIASYGVVEEGPHLLHKPFLVGDLTSRVREVLDS